MSDVEYSNRFMVFNTFDRGVQVIVNPLQLEMIPLLATGDYTVVELSVKIGQPKTTVQSSIGQLIKKGIIRGRKDPDDGRRILYRIAAALSLCDLYTANRRTAAPSNILSRFLKGAGVFDYNLFALSMETIEGYGISLDGLFQQFGVIVGQKIESMHKELDLNTILRLIKGAMAGVTVDVDTTEGIKITLGSELYDVRMFSMLTLSIVGLLMVVLPHHTGCRYGLVPDIKYDADRNTLTMFSSVFKGGYFEVDRWDVSKELFMDHRLGLYRIQNETYIITNHLMCSIIELLSEGGSRTVNEITEELGCPRINVYVAIRKLIKIGAVAGNGEQVRNETYRVSCERLLTMMPVEHTVSTRFLNESRYISAVETLEKLGTPEVYTSAFMDFIISYSSKANLIFDGFVERVADSILNGLFMIHPNLDREGFIDLICRLTNASNELMVESYNPIRYRFLRFDESRFLDQEGYLARIECLISQGLERITGINEDVEITIEDRRSVHSGNY